MISIIIPTYNEADTIEKLVGYLFTVAKNTTIEIIVSDGGSTDDTLKLAQLAGAKVVSSPKKGRAAQMNFGASKAIGTVLYFVHADAYPPSTFVDDIAAAISKGYSIGRYRTRFDSNHPFLKLNAFFTRFDWQICNGGDQTFYITTKLFLKLNGYDETMLIMEDYDLVTRAKKLSPLMIFKSCTLVSARKYETNSWLKVQLANKKIVNMYNRGASQQAMVDKYRQMLQYR